MATPHVAGVAALFLETNPTASPATVTAAIINSSTLNHVTSPGTGSPNRLLYSLLTGPPPRRQHQRQPRHQHRRLVEVSCSLILDLSQELSTGWPQPVSLQTQLDERHGRARGMRGLMVTVQAIPIRCIKQVTIPSTTTTATLTFYSRSTRRKRRLRLPFDTLKVQIRKLGQYRVGNVGNLFESE